MKRFFWYLKAGFLCAALFVLFGTSGVVAQDELFELEGGGGGVCITYACQQSTTNQCFCVGGADCNGCYIANGQGGCGSCAKR